MDTASADSLAFQFLVDLKKFNTFKQGEHFYFPSFRLGELECSLVCFPLGISEVKGEYVSLYLVIHSCPEKTVKLSFELSVMNNNKQDVLSSMDFDHLFTSDSLTCGSPKFMVRAVLDTVFVHRDSFYVVCTTCPPPEMSKEVCPLMQDIRKLREPNSMMDCKFLLQEETICAHRVLLGARSPVFYAQFFGDMAEKDSNAITISDVPANVFKAMINYIYTDALPESATFELMKGLLVAADKYLLKDLVVKCEQALLKRLSLDRAIDCLIIATQLGGICKLKNKCLELLCKVEDQPKLAVNVEYCKMISTYPDILSLIKERLA
ncbi:hypothetical protein LUZ61_005226 [Rhynchospora tenuis]|uniref:BTB domain-containing protein n=1 Tax=Rhynchospora tenuis TaxID=198213 RepID=A0AAD5ZP69_9POAL|nr:hypothetical protein LUZ61_005226 [Rhynchospora tenuis]